LARINRIGYGAVIGSFPQDLSFDPNANSGVEIGENNVIREYCTIHRGTKEGSNTLVGSNNLLMVGAHLGHNTRLGNNVILANNVLLGGYVEIHDRVFVGGGSVVHQFTRMGAISLLQGLSAISKDIPPFSIGVGRNAVWLCSSLEGSQTSIGKHSNRFSRVDEKQVRKNCRDHFRTLTANLLCSFVLTQKPWDEASSYIDISLCSLRLRKLRPLPAGFSR
jgi:acyl-ACP--UDP-N-acetylglucosamine O-acyltransferase